MPHLVPRGFTAILMTATVAALASPALAQDDFASVRAELEGKYERIRSLTADMTLEMEMDQAGMQGTLKGEGSVAYERGEDGIRRLRSDMVNTITAEGGMTMEQRMTTVNTGETTWVLTEMMGQKMVMETDEPDKGGRTQVAGTDMLDDLQEEYELTVKPEATLSGEPAYVLEGVVRERQPGGPAKVTFYLSKEHGYQLGADFHDAAGEKIGQMRYSNFEVNPDIAPERFEFEPPEGAMVIDESMMQGLRP